MDGQPLGEKNPKWLQDDYVKFIRFGQWRVEKTGEGILAFITPHGYLDNPTFRGMRQQLLRAFSEIYVLDLHGNANKKEKAPDGSEDKNIFDIKQGVAILLAIKKPNHRDPATVYHADLWGPKEKKYEALLKSDVSQTKWKKLNPSTPSYFFIPQDTRLYAEYQKGWKITDIFPVNSVGIVTARDRLTIHWTPEDAFMCMPRPEVMQHMLTGQNIGLISRHQMISDLMSYFFISKYLISDGVIRSDNKGGGSFFPLYIRDETSKRTPNFNPKFFDCYKSHLNKIGDPKNIFHYIYAIAHSPCYRQRYTNFLKQDFPRIPFTSDKKLFLALVEKGHQLAELHLMESPYLKKPTSKFPVKGDNLAGKPAYDAKTRRVYINKTQFFDSVTPETWGFMIGGYQVCQKWLKDRHNRNENPYLSSTEVFHYQKIVT
ncbi:MAG: type ISP restriction/modification enzyme, partial [Elusimicrobiota bacterium]